MPSAPTLCRPDSLGALLGAVRSELVHAIEAQIAAKGLELRFTQFLILERLTRLGPMRATELARAVDVDCGAMTRQLDQLEHRGYLRRCPHEQDRRALRIELTADGTALWRQLAGCGEQVVAAAQAPLDPSERKQLLDYLRRMLQVLRADH
ncbi:MAG TPA: MarR family transcriptional regulator [Rhodanobacter sp.]|nr:MarR family transcriptional regulator [Rhodanobacter sp.]